MRVRRLGAALVAAVTAATVPVPRPAPAAGPEAGAGPRVVEVRVDAGGDAGPRNTDLVGVNLRAATAGDLAPLRPRLLRIDANLESLAVCPGGATLAPTRLARLDSLVDTAFAAGGEPLVILSYMPPCLAAPGGLGLFGPTVRPPADPDAWGRLNSALLDALVTRRIAAGKPPVRRFETWNEPDWFVFFDGSRSEFVSRVFLPQVAAVAVEEGRSHTALRFGGCACVHADYDWFRELLGAAAAGGRPLDFLSWHYYANMPFLGPDGMEPIAGMPEWLYRLLALRSPFANPAVYDTQVRDVRAHFPGPELLLDEWNLSSGGFDRRNDTHEGAAFQAAALMAMQRGGLTAAAVYSSDDGSARDADGNPLPEWHGDWGLLTRSMRRKPAWYAHWLWSRLGERLVPVAVGASVWSGPWVTAARHHRGVAVLAASFRAWGGSDTRLRLTLAGVGPGRHRIALYRVDAAHPGGTLPVWTGTRRAGRDGTLRLDVELPAQSVVLAAVDNAM